MYKIALSANTSWYIYNFRKNTILSLLESGYEVSVVAPEDEYSQKLVSLGVKFFHIPIDRGGMNPIKDIICFFTFLMIYYRNNIDVVLNFTPKNNIYSTLAASIVGTKSINNIAGLGTLFISNSFASRIAVFLYKFSQKYASNIFFQNHDDMQLFRDRKISTGIRTDRLPGSGVDLVRFQVISAPDDGVVRFLLVARLLYNKGIGHYVDASRILKNKYLEKVEFNLLGFVDSTNPSGISQKQLDLWINEGVINYLGLSNEVEVHIAKADCMVLPSFYREGVPKSLLEAGAMGKPIVTTDNVGCRETVDDSINGFLCEPRSTSSLVSKLELIINMSHDQRLSMGAKSRQKIKTEFDEKLVIDKYLSVIEDVLKK